MDKKVFSLMVRLKLIDNGSITFPLGWGNF